MGYSQQKSRLEVISQILRMKWGRPPVGSTGSPAVAEDTVRSLLVSGRTGLVHMGEYGDVSPAAALVWRCVSERGTAVCVLKPYPTSIAA